MNKIKIGLVFEDKNTAKIFVAFVCANMQCGKIVRDSKYEFIYETPIMICYWIKPMQDFLGRRLNFVFTTKEIRDTDWFDEVIRPTQIGGTSAIDENMN